jgi:hypothetical protein
MARNGAWLPEKVTFALLHFVHKCLLGKGFRKIPR